MPDHTHGDHEHSHTKIQVRITGKTHLVKTDGLDVEAHQKKVNDITKGKNVIESISQINGVGDFIREELHLITEKGQTMITIIKELNVEEVIPDEEPN
jgi:hypothetical protein